jgi:hypothetical protein
MEKKEEQKRKSADCENCQYLDYDEEYGDYVCTQSLDEDELVRVMQGGASYCPYYRYYNEYDMVRKQN